MSNWDDVKKKIQDLEKDPFLNTDMLRTLDTISIADYWRRRFEEEHVLSEKKLGGKDEEIGQLREKLERQKMELQLSQQQFDSARHQLGDKQLYWEEKNHVLELENRGLRDRIDWEVKSRVLEEQNRFLQEQVQRRALGYQEPEPVSRARREAPQSRPADDAELQEFKYELGVLKDEKRKWEDERGRLQASVQEAESLRKSKEELVARVQQLEKELEENAKNRDRLAPLSQKLEILNKQMEQREKEHLLGQEDLGRGFAHRVRNYLGIMSGTLQLCVANYKMGEELEQQVKLVDENAQEMLKAIEEFLSLVRVPELTMESLDLNEFMARTFAALDDKIKAANVSVQFKKMDALPAVRADPRLLAEGVAAILANSLEAMPEGGRMEVETLVRSEDQTVLVRFKDSGKGINDTHIRKVFQPYFTTKKGRKGLGLSICKRIMELHRGVVELTSAKGAGTTLTLVFPLPEPGSKML